MQVRLVAGRAGSGKTFRCLAEVRQALLEKPEGRPLLFVAPKQTTYHLERQLLTGSELTGFSRLRIFSFERLADFVFSQTSSGTPEILDEDGRLMVLRALLARRRDSFKLFRASARLNGFARQLSLLLREFQHSQITPESLAAMAQLSRENNTLSSKLQDLSTILKDYLDWAKQRGWQDTDFLLTRAAEKLDAARHEKDSFPPIAELWVDGFAEWSLQELELIAALIPHCARATITFCLAQFPQSNISWLSLWASVQKAFEQCRKRLQEIPGVEISLEMVEREPGQNRFTENPILRHLERVWGGPSTDHPNSRPMEVTTGCRPETKVNQANQLELGFSSIGSDRPEAGEDWPPEKVASALRLAKCTDPETEATVAAHEILAHVRGGGRFRDIAVLVRDLEKYHSTIQRVFSRSDIPFFLDRREPVSHHPLAELTRNAIRTVAFDWRTTDWFAALKTGLVPAEEEEIDELETAALARGWQGRVWNEPLRMGELARRPHEVEDLKKLGLRLESLRQRILPPFQRFALAVGLHRCRPTGAELAAAIRDLWTDLRVEETLQTWLERENGNGSRPAPDSIHVTVRDQMGRWLSNLELAFPGEGLSLKEWLPILEAGLTNLTVGLIPPALDQVTIGTIERSRNPEVNLAVVLGLNEGVFPDSLSTGGLLTETDRDDLEKHGLPGNLTARQRLSRERFHAYVAFTRARQRLVVTYSIHDSNAKALSPSPFIDHLLRIFPSLSVESITPELDWREAQHPSEMVEPLLLVENYRREHVQKNETQKLAIVAALHHWQRLKGLPTLGSVLGVLRDFDRGPAGDSISPAVAVKLYGTALNTSVSRMEHFAACPFKFFVNSGLRAEAREVFVLDVKEQGSFQHDALAEFHSRLQREGKRWRDITPQEARQRMAADAARLALTYRDGLLQANDQSRFMAVALNESLQNFVETLIGWMGSQYQFDPVAVELPFGHDENSPAWELELSNGRRIAIFGRIDRVDLFQPTDSDAGLCVVVDYKSSQKQLDPVLVTHGVQLQLLTYLSVLRTWKNPERLFHVRRLIPSAVFYVNLTGRSPTSVNRTEALLDAADNRKRAYRHSGRFDLRFLRLLDARPDALEGDQFNYQLSKKDGSPRKNSSDIMQSAEFSELLDSIELNLKTMGEEIYNGTARVAPYQKGQTVACNQCEYQSICRIDRWTHNFRILK